MIDLVNKIELNDIYFCKDTTDVYYDVVGLNRNLFCNEIKHDIELNEGLYCKLNVNHVGFRINEIEGTDIENIKKYLSIIHNIIDKYNMILEDIKLFRFKSISDIIYSYPNKNERDTFLYDENKKLCITNEGYLVSHIKVKDIQIPILNKDSLKKVEISSLQKVGTISNLLELYLSEKGEI